MIYVLLRTACGCTKVIRVWDHREHVVVPLGHEGLQRRFRPTLDYAEDPVRGRIRVYVEVCP